MNIDEMYNGHNILLVVLIFADFQKRTQKLAFFHIENEL